MGLVAFLAAAPAQAATERALYLHYTHTKETARIVFKRNGQYVQSGLNELNQFLRDWRRNEPAKMDPRLFDLVWEVYQEVGGSQPINVVSAYRSPATNAMLAKNSSGVADDSQHMRGTAMDFFIPGVPLTKLRAVAMKKQVGGVGYYPTSGSPFVHLDTGSVRAWPRMTRAQLKEIFPDGRTMHLPTDGKPLSQEGYQVALAEWKRCHAYPCNGSSSGTQVASSGGSGRTLMDVLFGGGGDSQPAASPAPQVQTASLTPQPSGIAPVMPVARPADLGAGVPAATEAAAIADEPLLPFSTAGSAPLTPDELGHVQLASLALPVAMPDDLRSQRASALPSGDAVTALAALTAPAMPTPRLLMTEPPAEILTAYLPAQAPDAGAQRTLEAIITGATAPAAIAAGLRLPGLPAPLDATPDQPANAMDGLFDRTFDATGAAGPDALADALARHVASQSAESGMRRPDLIAPDLDHVADIFTAPVSLTSSHFAVIFDHDEADFDPTPEMGRYVLVKGVSDAGPGQMRAQFPISVMTN
ncbi:DUF882 domain-containing protein [Devosia sp. YIM 151766]|uniref:DUF882 domain-containing protein n=1 Tax=Devosia sp. YIM 151766 TaxID=3017325 RepID=UPI00255C45FB|nr:DUF882 domain-containing protein [Devosia sp. YIM 151766]WIY54536.1 DUF882 domain-containing protein [Devosia sp. YIM 151766]